MLIIILIYILYSIRPILKYFLRNYLSKNPQVKKMILSKYIIFKCSMLSRNFDVLDDEKNTTEVLIIQRNSQIRRRWAALSAIEM